MIDRYMETRSRDRAIEMMNRTSGVVHETANINKSCCVLLFLMIGV